MPKVVFKKMNLDRNIEIVSWCIKENDEILDVHSKTISLFPELKNVNDDSLIKNVVTKKYKENENILEERAVQYEKVWSKYNDDFFKELWKYLDIDWPDSNDTILANIGIIPVCPRDVNDFRFDLFEDMTDEKLVETCAHELCHFLWFTKWKKIFPDYDKEDFESPSIIWEYSEMVVDPILNSPEFVKLFGKKSKYSYDSFYEKKGLMEGLFRIYEKSIPIEEKIKNGFDYVKRNKSSLK